MVSNQSQVPYAGALVTITSLTHSSPLQEGEDVRDEDAHDDQHEDGYETDFGNGLEYSRHLEHNDSRDGHEYQAQNARAGCRPSSP